MSACQELILHAAITLHDMGHPTFTARDIYQILHAGGCLHKELTVRNYIYAGRLDLPGEWQIDLDRVGRGVYRLRSLEQARAALAFTDGAHTPA